jgi:hypothetical protein
MMPAYGRAFLRVLVAVGVSGLAAEIVFIAFSVLTVAEGSDTSDLMLAETAIVAFTYGAVFVIAVLARKFPAWAFRPLISHETRGKKRMRARLIVPLALVMYAVVASMQVVFLVIGLSTAKDVMVSLLHFYPITGLMVASGIAARGASVATPTPGAG